MEKKHMPHNYEEGPKPPKEEHAYSESGSWDADIDWVMNQLGQDSEITADLLELKKDQEKVYYLATVLGSQGYKLRDLWCLSEDAKAGKAFRQLLASWDELIDGKPKTFEQRRQEIKEFAGLLY
jgi:hypothetical protein